MSPQLQHKMLCIPNVPRTAPGTERASKNYLLINKFPPTVALPRLGPILSSILYPVSLQDPIPVNPSLLPQLCANLDTWHIMSPQNHRPELQEHCHQPCKQYDLCHRRSQVCGGRGMGLGCGLE